MSNALLAMAVVVAVVAIGVLAFGAHYATPLWAGAVVAIVIVAENGVLAMTGDDEP